jgi:hypothetical protein
VSWGVQVWVQHMSSPSQSASLAQPQRQLPASSMQIPPPAALPVQASAQSEQFSTVPSMVSQPALPASQSACPGVHWYRQTPSGQEWPVVLG